MEERASKRPVGLQAASHTVRVGLLWACAVCTLAFAPLSAQGLRTLSPEAVRDIVRAYHPVVRIAALRVGGANAAILAARGAFDPTAAVAVDRKSFDGKTYYGYAIGELSIPTWYGLELKTGIEDVVGDRISPERTPGTTSYAGVKWNATAVVLDTRRAVLRQAQALQTASMADQRAAANDVQFEALAAYWAWVQSYAALQVAEGAVRITRERLRFVALEYEGGARPAIDTTESLAQLQSFLADLEDARLDWQNSGLLLSRFLWTENGEPAAWSESIVPDSASAALSDPTLSLPPLGDLLAAIPLHPKLQSVEAKIGVLQTDQLLKQQYLLPKVSVYAGGLSRGYFRQSETTAPMLQNNHKLSLDFSLPLALRESRGAFRAARLKVAEARVGRDSTELSIETKIRSYYNEVVQLGAQLSATEGALQSYQRLAAGERIRYEAGESTVFLMNARETKVIETRRKLISLRAKWQKARAGALWAAGILE